MANHASAIKRARQNKVRKAVNTQYLSKLRTALNKFNSSVETKNTEEIVKSFQTVNSLMAKAQKRIFLKKKHIQKVILLIKSNSKKIIFFIFFYFYS